jgi:pSer/pThr/pTyr-binding forkhead associated (FHA) protein
VLAKTDPLQDAPGDSDNVHVTITDSRSGHGLLVVRSGDQTGESFALDIPIVSIGRHPESVIYLDDVTVSRRHAEVHHVGGAYVVRDLGSLNGTYVDQERVEEQQLMHGDELQIGKFRMVYFDGAEVSS